MNQYMNLALKEAEKALNNNDIPVGAVIVKDGMVISKAFNNSLLNKIDNHAEILAINKAIRELNDWRLNDCDMYVTLEPCPMCAGAIAKSRIRKVYIGTKSNIEENSKIMEKIFNTKTLNSKIVYEYLNNKECSDILNIFFKRRR